MHPEKQSPSSKNRRPWWLRILRGLGWTLLVLALLHRPIIHYGVPALVHPLAKRQHLDVRFKLAGSIFTNLLVSEVHVTPTGTGPTPVVKIDIAELKFFYSLPKLIRSGIGNFLHSYEVHHADLVFRADPSKTEEEKDQKVTIAQQLNNILAQPAAYADQVWIDDFTVRVVSPETQTVIGPLYLSLHPERAGELHIGLVKVPGVPEWKSLSATTSYADRNLFIRGLELSPDLVIEKINFEPGKEKAKAGRVFVDARVFGGNLNLELSGKELPTPGEKLEKSYATLLKVRAGGIDVPALTTYFGMEKPPVGKLGSLTLDFTGEPERPQTWVSDFKVQVEKVAAGPLALEPVEISGKTENGRATIDGGFSVGANTGRLSVQAALPASIKEFSQTDVDASLVLDAPKLGELAAKLDPAPDLSGAVRLNVKVATRSGRADASGTLTLSQFAFTTQSVAKGDLKFSVSKPLAFDAKAPLAALVADVTGEFTEIRAGTTAIDSVNLSVAANGPQIALRNLEVKRGVNAFTARGNFLVPADPKEIAAAPADLDFSLKAPALEAFGLGTAERQLAGHLEGKGTIRNVAGVPAGEITLDGGDFKFGEAGAQRLSAKITLGGGFAVIEQLGLAIDDRNQITASGKVGTAAPFAYEASVQVAMPELAKLQGALESFGVKETLAGALEVNWSGQGEAQPARHLGEARVAATGVKYGKFDVRAVRIAGRYDPQTIETSEIHVESGPTTLDTHLLVKDQRLSVSQLKVQQGEQQVLTGGLSVPFDLQNPKAVLKSPEPLEVKLEAAKLDIAKLFASLGKDAPVSGSISADVVASGNMTAPVLTLKVAAREIKAAAAPKYDAAQADVTVHYAHRLMELEATAKQPLIKPLVIRGKIPIDLGALGETSTIDPETPVEATVTLPASSLAFLPKVVPSVRRIEGNVSIDVKVGGTVSKPSLGGTAALRIKSARMSSPTIPSIDDFVIDLGFDRDSIALRTVRGVIGGGKFELKGGVELTEMTNPTFDLAMTADQVLVKRDDTISVRADAQLKLTGPLNAASATGTVWVVNSKFFKEIDILPIGLPGRPKPVPRSAPSEALSVSFPNPPLRDWTFDIVVKTRPNDPFEVRGNLATGAVSLDVRLGGTGLQPWLDGAARVETLLPRCLSAACGSRKASSISDATTRSSRSSKCRRNRKFVITPCACSSMARPLRRRSSLPVSRRSPMQTSSRCSLPG